MPEVISSTFFLDNGVVLPSLIAEWLRTKMVLAKDARIVVERLSVAVEYLTGTKVKALTDFVPEKRVVEFKLIDGKGNMLSERELPLFFKTERDVFEVFSVLSWAYNDCIEKLNATNVPEIDEGAAVKDAYLYVSEWLERLEEAESVEGMLVTKLREVLKACGLWKHGIYINSCLMIEGNNYIGIPEGLINPNSFVVTARAVIVESLIERSLYEPSVSVPPDLKESLISFFKSIVRKRTDGYRTELIPIMSVIFRKKEGRTPGRKDPSCSILSFLGALGKAKNADADREAVFWETLKGRLYQ
jgi:hypothetical protein